MQAVADGQHARVVLLHRTLPALPTLAARVVLVVFGLVVIGTPVAPSTDAAITRPFTPTRTIALAPGIDFSVGRVRTTGGRIQSVRVATVDPGHPSVRLRSLLSNDKVIRKERPSHLAERKSRPGNQAMVATNGDRSVFGRLDAYAAPHSMHISNGELMVARACTRPTLGIDRSGGARIDDVRVHLQLTPVRGGVGRKINRVNTHRDDGLNVLFTKRFGPSTRTKAGGIEVVLSLEDTLRPSGVQVVKVLKVRRGGGDTRLRAGQAVLSARDGKGKWFRQLKVGKRLRLESAIVRKVDKPCGGKLRAANGWDDIVEAMGGNFFTARHKRVKAPSGRVYALSTQRHPRTNIGVTADGRVLMVTVDGRQPGYSVGVTLAEMGRLMLSLGATDALNLDGGGSTVMAKRSLKDGKFRVTNRPSDGRERKHSQALAAFELTASP